MKQCDSNKSHYKKNSSFRYDNKETISVGGIPKSKEVCTFKVDITYHRFFALAVLIFNATWSKHCGKVQKYTFYRGFLEPGSQNRFRPNLGNRT